MVRVMLVFLVQMTVSKACKVLCIVLRQCYLLCIHWHQTAVPLPLGMETAAPILTGTVMMIQ